MLDFSRFKKTMLDMKDALADDGQAVNEENTEV